MNPSKALARVVLLGAGFAAVTSAARGQSYGPEPQRLMIGAAEFRPEHRYEPFVGLDGYVSLGHSEARTSPTPVYIQAPLSLPEGAVIEASPGETVLDAALRNGIEIEHACEKSCACTTCHVVIREGFNSLEASDELEDDMLDKAWGLEPTSRLSCQAVVDNQDLVVEIPKYTISQVSEGH